MLLQFFLKVYNYKKYTEEKALTAILRRVFGWVIFTDLQCPKESFMIFSANRSQQRNIYRTGLQGLVR